MITKRNKELLHCILIMLCICTFLDCQREPLQKYYYFYISSKEAIMFPYGIGFKSTNQRRYLKIKEKKILEYIIDETLIKVGAEFIWLWWITIESKNKEILALSISKERNMFVVAERFLSRMVNDCGKHQFQQMMEAHGILCKLASF